MIAELLLASALGALALASAIALRKSLGQGPGPSLRGAVEGQAKRLRKVLRRPHRPVERPRVMVQGPKVKPVICQICLGRVKEGMEYGRCSCGKTFHPMCLSRTGFCPYCDHAYEGELPEGLMVRPQPVAGRRRADVRMIWEPAGRRACPMCGEELEEGSAECSCGAIVIEEGEVFDCPSCGTEVPPHMMQCPGCRERFDSVEEPQCPICGRLVTSEDGVCECGGLAVDECPECGAPLGPEDAACASCGTAFELV